jgi:hypothetical protein
MPAPLPSDQLNIIRNLIAKGDQAGAIKVYIEATGSTQAEAEEEVTNLATRYGLVGHPSAGLVHRGGRHPHRNPLLPLKRQQLPRHLLHRLRSHNKPPTSPLSQLPPAPLLLLLLRSAPLRHPPRHP